MKKIQLTRGQVALVDDADFEELSMFKWRALRRKNTWYAQRSLPRAGRKTTPSVLMHRQITCAASGMDVDHINHDGLDNRRSNLRVVTHRENLQNLRRKTECTSRFPGVDWQACSRKWRARVLVDGVRVNLGVFSSEEDAAAAYRSFVASLEVAP